LLGWTALAVPSFAADHEIAAAQAAIGAALDHSRVPGMGAAVIRDRHVAAVAVGGVRRTGKSDPVRPGDHWLIGSNAEPMTATMVLRLVEQHRRSPAAPLPSTDPALAVAARPASGNGLDWGYRRTIGHWQGPVLEHTGSDEAWMSIVVLFPDSRNGLLVNANVGNGMGGEPPDKSVLKALLPLVTHQVKSPAGK
jgi:hypothetical protein